MPLLTATPVPLTAIMNPQFNKLLLILIIIVTNFSCSHLKKHEIAEIHFEAFGDFGSEQSELTLFKIDAVTKAKLEIKNGRTYIADVNQQGLDSFYGFVNELRSLKKGGHCTTDVSCMVYTRNDTIERTQINCKWNGFEYLKGALFKGQGIGKIMRYEEKMNDPTINSDFSIRYGNYDLYFNVQKVRLWCDKMIDSNDGLQSWYKNIKQEVNREPANYGVDNHSWLMTLFTPRIVNVNTKEEGKSLLVRQNDTLATDRTYFIITPQNDTIKLFDSIH
jgi:hypothetical protein